MHPDQRVTSLLLAEYHLRMALQVTNAYMYWGKCRVRVAAPCNTTMVPDKIKLCFERSTGVVLVDVDRLLILLVANCV